ncbi:MAG: DNA cytosine methyltransferase [Candidatus Thiodiazotropha sp. (ex Dulcina madagascariensis)]|nr:DNA cytosine methyltransferase [Candidatus Thiodiazotropha sp. (ex Dulcina madagascariensis)]
MHTFYEFFAGGGMARAGLGRGWKCLFANDIDTKKAAAYRENWGSRDLIEKDVATVSLSKLPDRADLAWASFPCQDLSLAGAGAGLKAKRSGTFWPFWDLMRSLVKEGRGPKLIVLENVYGALTSHGGKDFAAIGSALSGSGYRFGAMVIDAVHFVPQSRPRLFIVGVHQGLKIPSDLRIKEPNPLWHLGSLVSAQEVLSQSARKKWIWWNLPTPEERQATFADLIERVPLGVEWHTPEQTERLLDMMTPLHREKVSRAQAANRLMVGGVYKRTRQGVQRAEARFDDVSGCLRTPAGGSSRQIILVVEGKKVSSRLVSPRETARLMGLDDRYKLPTKYNAAYHLTGDGVVVPVVRFLASNVLEPILKENVRETRRPHERRNRTMPAEPRTATAHT